MTTDDDAAVLVPAAAVPALEVAVREYNKAHCTTAASSPPLSSRTRLIS